MTIKRILIVLTMALFSSSTFAEVVVIVNAGNDTSTMKKSQLSRIFMGKATAFENGGKAVAINQITASSSRAGFDSGLLGKTTAQINAYWSKQMFSGGGTPPEELNGDLAVLQYVSANPESIGYVDSSVVNGAVKVVQIQ